MATIEDSYPLDSVKILGYASGGGAVGMMLFPSIFEFLIQLCGWRGAFMLLGAVNANVIVCGLLVTANSARKERSEYTALESENKLEDALRKLANYFSFYFIKNPSFISIIIVHTLNGLVFNGWTIFLVPHAIAKGLSPQVASFLSFSGGLGTLFGRPLVGPVMDICKLTAVQYMIIIALVNTVAFGVDIFVKTFWFMAILALVNGFATSSLPIITFGAIAEVLGEEHAVEGYSFAWIFYGVGDFVGGFLLGKFLNIEYM